MDGREGCEGLERRVDCGEAVVAFSVGRVSVGRIMQIADADQLLPPKVWLFSRVLCLHSLILDSRPPFSTQSHFLVYYCVCSVKQKPRPL